MGTETQKKPSQKTGPLTSLGLAFANWSARWFPDPLVFALIAVVLVFVLAVGTGENPATVATAGGKSFWQLSNFTMQMAMVVIGGYVVATSKPVAAIIESLSKVPKRPRAAVAFIALFSVTTALLSWGLSMIFSAQLIRAIARRMPSLDYRAAGSAGYLGLGVTWALGLSSSAAMLMATPTSLPPALLKISGIIPLADTLFTWQNAVLAATLCVASVLAAFLSAPGEGSSVTAADLGIPLADEPQEKTKAATPGEWLEHMPILSLLVVVLLGYYLYTVFVASPVGPLAALDLNTYNLIFLTAGLLLHWRPSDFLRAVTKSVPATAGVLIQFPFYAIVFGMIVNTGLSEKISDVFIHISTRETYPLLVASYSSVLGIFIPSGGSKWLIEAPYVLEAAHATGNNLAWTVQIYNAAEALPNLINPFWMLPMLAILKCRARDLVGYGMLQLILLLPIAYALCWALAMTF